MTFANQKCVDRKENVSGKHFFFRQNIPNILCSKSHKYWVEQLKKV